MVGLQRRMTMEKEPFTWQRFTLPDSYRSDYAFRSPRGMDNECIGINSADRRPETFMKPSVVEGF